MFGSSCVSSAFSGPQLPSSLQRTKPSEGGGGGGLIRDPVPGKAAPPFSFSASAPRIFPFLWRRWMGRSATLQRWRRQPLLPSLRGCLGGHCQLSPPLHSLRLARKNPVHTALSKGARGRSAPLPPRARHHGSGQRGIEAEEAPAASTTTADAARKRSPGGC